MSECKAKECEAPGLIFWIIVLVIGHGCIDTAFKRVNDKLDRIEQKIGESDAVVGPAEKEGK